MRYYISANMPRRSFNIYTVIIVFIFILVNPAITIAQEVKPIVPQKCFFFINTPAFKLKAATGKIPNIVFNLKEGTVLTDQEFKMVSLVNQEREEAGLAKLEVDQVLVKLSEVKGLDMVRFNYFSHHSRRLGTVYDQLDHLKYNYRFAAENLIGAPDYYRAEEGVMASSAHRSNVLNPHFKRIGIGVITGGPYGVMIVQVLTD